MMERFAKDDWPEGWFSAEEALAYQRAVLNVLRGVVVEVGCWYGRSISMVAPICAMRGTRLYAVDTWRGSRPGDPTHTMASTGPDPAKVFWANLERLGLRSYVVPVRGESVAAAARFPDDYIDLAFLDADHSRESVAADLAAWWPKIKQGGVLMGHDFADNWPGVKEAVTAHAASLRLPIICPAGSLWRIHKIPEVA